MNEEYNKFDISGLTRFIQKLYEITNENPVITDISEYLNIDYDTDSNIKKITILYKENDLPCNLDIIIYEYFKININKNYSEWIKNHDGKTIIIDYIQYVNNDPIIFFRYIDLFINYKPLLQKYFKDIKIKYPTDLKFDILNRKIYEKKLNKRHIFEHTLITEFYSTCLMCFIKNYAITFNTGYLSFKNMREITDSSFNGLTLTHDEKSKIEEEVKLFYKKSQKC
jgi:hypothetical protein